jgi:hypothetical protein
MELTKLNFAVYAAKCYDNPNCESTEEFHEDLKHFKYVKRLINKYVDTGVLNERLIINHLIIIYNLFGQEAGTKMIFFKMKGLERYIKPFLVFLNRMPNKVEIDHQVILDSDLSMDPYIVSILRKM